MATPRQKVRNIKSREHWQRPDYRPIEDYGIIGDLHTVALVGSDGSIDWCCLPHFDSPSVFASILDSEKGGFFRIAPVDAAVHKQMYVPETNILMTRFLSPDGVGECTDFMPIDGDPVNEKHNHEIVRQVRVIRGNVRFKVECFPAFDYARGKHTLKLEPGGAVFTAEDQEIGLSTSVELHAKNDGVEAEFELSEGETATFLLRQTDSHSSLPACDSEFDSDRSYNQTLLFWRGWAAGISYRGRWREMVMRSALTLKLLTFAPSGAMVAAATTSLPEELGGGRNWDYRYTWIRDAAFTVYGFLRLGLTSEAEHFVHWIEERAHETAPDGALQIMYGLRGEHELPELELDHLEGYKGSSPVRIGNEASTQLQLDIYGELLDAVYLSNKYGEKISFEFWQHLRGLLDYVTNNWHRKDEGIWEVRGGRQHMVYSKLMCWVALDRGIRLANERSFPGPHSAWIEARDAIYEEIMTKGWNETKRSFVQHYDTDTLDASNLIMPLVFFISPTDPRMISTLDATIETLVSDSLVNRYETGPESFDGLGGDEGSFNMCTFWLVEALTRSGRTEEARLIFEKMLSYANHLGLYAEEVGRSGEALGNFPQAFTHMGLISAAFNLDRALGD